MMFRSNKGFRESPVWEALRQLAVAWPRLKMATMAFFNRLLQANETVGPIVVGHEGLQPQRGFDNVAQGRRSAALAR